MNPSLSLEEIILYLRSWNPSPEQPASTQDWIEALDQVSAVLHSVTDRLVLSENNENRLSSLLSLIPLSMVARSGACKRFVGNPDNYQRVVY
jgi:hypothetical protein